MKSELHNEPNEPGRLDKTRTFFVLTGCAIYLAGLGWIDRATGYELGLFAFYTAPVAVIAWNLSLRSGIVVAFIASVIWFMADRYAGNHYSARFYAYWNTAMHFSSFIINAITFAKLRTGLDRRHALECSLAQARQELESIKALVINRQGTQPPPAP